MTKSNKTSRAYLLWEIVGLVVAVAGVVATVIVFPNWNSRADIDVYFPKNTSEKITSYYSVNNDSLRVAQTKGDDNCTYTIYYQARNQSGYDMIVRNVSFDENDTWNGKTYSLSRHWWNDVRFKVKKSAGLSTASTLELNIGVED